MGSKAPKYNSSKANVNYTPVQFTPYNGQPLQYTVSPDLQQSLTNIGEMVNNTPNSSPFMDTANDYFNRILGDNYQAYSNDYLNEKYNSSKDKLQKDFKTQENQVASHLANSGLAGSGISTGDWAGQAKLENEALADVWQNLVDMNEQATRQDKAMALQMAPTLAQTSLEYSQLPLQNQMAYASVLQQQNNAQNEVDMYNAQQDWNEWLQQMGMNQFNASNALWASGQNAQAYRDWYNTAVQQANSNNAMFGGLIGTGLSLIP